MSIMRKKHQLQLQPLKINKTDASSQALMLQLLSKMINQQRESNKLLRKIAGETDFSQESSFSAHSSSRNNNLKMPKKNNQHIQQILDSSERQNSNASLPFIKNKIFQQNFLNNGSIIQQIPHSLDNTGMIVKGLQNLKDVMQRIQVSLRQTMKANSLINFNKGIQQKSIKQKGKIQFDQTKIDKSQNEINQKKIMENDQIKTKNQINDNFSKKNELAQKPPQKIQSIMGIIKLAEDITAESKYKAKKAKIQKRKENLMQFMLDQKQNKINNKAILRVDREKEQNVNYVFVKQILPYCDKRQMKIKVNIQDVLALHNLKYFQTHEQLSSIIEYWIGKVYMGTASICWNLLNSGKLSIEETKILFTENIIYNYIQCMKNVKMMQKKNPNKIDIKRSKLTQQINNKSIDALTYLCTLYPQTKVQDPSIALRKAIPSIDNKGQVEYDLIAKISRAKQVIFRQKQGKDYTQQIMKTINYMIDKTNEQFQPFKEMFSDIFQKIYIPIDKRKQENYQETKDDQLYAENVKSYSKYLIGRKIHKNTPKYTDFEIQNGIFFVKSPSILRIITKWVEELDQMVQNPEATIKNTQNQFKDHEGTLIYLYAQIKNGLYKHIKEKQKDFGDIVTRIKEECYAMQVLLTIQNFTEDPTQKYLSRQSISVGKYCYYLKNAISSYICSQLNEVIHFLLSIPSQVDQTKIGISNSFYQEEVKKDLSKLNLVHFRIFDLLRCKCISKEGQILYLINKLNEKHNNPNDSFKIMRIKDRLNLGTRDVLINAAIGNGLICQIQLAVITNIDKKQQLLDQYQHFLYELQRAKMGPLSQNAAIWSNLQQRASFFQQQIKSQQKFVKHGEKKHKCIKVEASQNLNISPCLRPIVCASCRRFYQIPKTCLLNISCSKCLYKFCGQCHLLHMNSENKKEYLFEKHFRPLFPYMKEFTNYNEPLPKYGFVIRKYYLKKQLLYFKVIVKNRDNQDENQNNSIVEIQIVTSNIENNKIVSKPINRRPLEAQIKNGKYYIKKDDIHKEQLNNFIIYSIDTSKNLSMHTLPYHEIFANFVGQKLKYINLIKQPMYIQQFKVLKRNKLISRQAKQLSDLFKQQKVMITYLKLDKLIIISQIQIQDKKIQDELIKIINIRKLKNYAIQKTFAVSMDFRQMTNQMDLIADTKNGYFQEQTYKNFTEKTSKLYLNFGKLENILFAEKMKNLKQLYFSGNMVKSLTGIQNLTFLQDLIFDNNFVDSLLPVKNLLNLVQISASQNKITSMQGIQNLSKLKNICLYKNQIKKIQYVQKIKLKELSLNQSQVVDFQNISHMNQTLEEFCIGGNQKLVITPIIKFVALKKLFLEKINLTRFDPIWFKDLSALTKLSLAHNLIQKIDTFEAENNEIVQLSFKNNRIKEITGLQGCTKLTYLRLQQNLITNIGGIQANQQLQKLNLQENPLQDCKGLYDFVGLLQIKFTTAQALNVPPENRPTSQFYDRYDLYLQNKANSSSGNYQGQDNDDEQQDDGF